MRNTRDNKYWATKNYKIVQHMHSGTFEVDNRPHKSDTKCIFIDPSKG